MNLITQYQQALSNQMLLPNPSHAHAIAEMQHLYDAHQKWLSLPWWQRIISAQRPAHCGIYLWGEVGRGKTRLLDMFYTAIPLTQKKRWHFQEFMQYVHQELQRLQGKINPLKKIAKKLAAEYQVICLDELMIEDVADATILSHLFQTLLARRVLLIITANPKPDALYKSNWQKERVAPLIACFKQYLQLLEIKNPEDYRKREPLTHTAYFYPDDHQAMQQLNTFFEQYAHPPISQNILIDINGHTLLAKKMSETVLWCDFSMLCGSPRNAADYLVLANRFNYILISHIPVLTEAFENEARRLMSLVDVCYDQNIILLMSAPVPLPELYQGRHLQQVFMRTLSRLWEMQAGLAQNV